MGKLKRHMELLVDRSDHPLVGLPGYQHGDHYLGRAYGLVSPHAVLPLGVRCVSFVERYDGQLTVVVSHPTHDDCHTLTRDHAREVWRALRSEGWERARYYEHVHRIESNVYGRVEALHPLAA